MKERAKIDKKNANDTNQRLNYFMQGISESFLYVCTY